MNPHAYLQDEQQIKDIESIYRVDKDGILYHMDCKWNYYNLPKEAQAFFDAGCSAFATKNLKEEHLFCRNYDYSHRLGNKKTNPVTGCNIIVHCENPYAKFKSIGVADAFWLDYRNGSIVAGSCDNGVTDLSFFTLAPYLCMDGLNEAGLALSILALPLDTDWEEIEYDTWQSRQKKDADTDYKLETAGETPDKKYSYAVDGMVVHNDADKKAWIAHQTQYQQNKPGRPVVLHPMLMRYMLDKCATVEEAIAVANTVNVRATVPGSTYHIIITDKTGKTVVLEWQGDEMIVTEACHCTNFFISREDKLGAGYDRDEVIDVCLKRFNNGIREDLAEDVLQLVAQDPDNGKKEGKTQYSCIYNLEQQSLKIFSFGDFTQSWDFKI